MYNKILDDAHPNETTGLFYSGASICGADVIFDFETEIHNIEFLTFSVITAQCITFLGRFSILLALSAKITANNLTYKNSTKGHFSSIFERTKIKVNEAIVLSIPNTFNGYLFENCTVKANKLLVEGSWRDSFYGKFKFNEMCISHGDDKIRTNLSAKNIKLDYRGRNKKIHADSIEIDGDLPLSHMSFVNFNEIIAKIKELYINGNVINAFNKSLLYICNLSITGDVAYSFEDSLLETGIFRVGGTYKTSITSLDNKGFPSKPSHIVPCNLDWDGYEIGNLTTISRVKHINLDFEQKEGVAFFGDAPTGNIKANNDDFLVDSIHGSSVCIVTVNKDTVNQLKRPELQKIKELRLICVSVDQIPHKILRGLKKLVLCHEPSREEVHLLRKFGLI